MRLPFIQLESDFIRHGARALALEVGIPDPHALGLAAMLWEWAASKDGDECAPSGIVTGRNAAAHIERAAGWDGEKGRLVAALQEPEVGLLEAIPDGFRVRGLDRYRDAWEKQQKERQRWHQRKEAIKPGASGTTPPEHQRSTNGKTQTQMETQKKEPTASPSAATAPSGQASLLDVQPPALSTKPKRPPNAVAQWHERACKARAEVVGPAAVDATTLHGHQWARLGEALKDHGAKLLDAAFARFLGDAYARERDCPLGLFVAQVERWMTEAKAGPPRQPETAAQRMGLVGKSEACGPCATGCGQEAKCESWGHALCLRCAGLMQQEVANFNPESVSAWVTKARAA